MAANGDPRTRDMLIRNHVLTAAGALYALALMHGNDRALRTLASELTSDASWMDIKIVGGDPDAISTSNLAALREMFPDATVIGPGEQEGEQP